MRYPSIRIEGSILSSDILDAIERDEKGFQKPKDFGLDVSARVKDEIASTWADARDQWRIFSRKTDALKENATGTTETRNLWMTPLLGLLAYNIELATKGEDINGKNYPISHRDTKRDEFPIHIVGCNESLDKRPGDGSKRMSPHALVQEYLNLTEHLYAIVSNGRLLRLLRDSTRLVKLSFIEFDLDRMFEEELFADFAIMYRLLHASRMPVSQESATESPIEIYHQDALDSGSRIREGLSAAVEKSIRSLANGFLKHPANESLRQSISSEQVDSKTYYQWLLRLIYRLLFLMVIEERDLIFAPKSDRRHRDIYYSYYGISRLRKLSEHRHFADRRYQDGWKGLRHTFLLFEDRGHGAKLGIAPLAGELFEHKALGSFPDCELDNEVLLTCIRNLSVFTNPITGQPMRVNYAALNVEEFGSVYEGLLEYDPQILEIEGQFEFSFIAGDDRASSGSHYTPDELVQPLIKHSLDYIIEEKLKEANPEKALLSITVCDVACGSGHILLNAARRIATALAIIRTGDDQPTPSAFRTAVRDVIRNCIYGVDLNPLAVELCKVSLWLEAHIPGEPLNFLDHHIKCGNAIVGLAHRDELKRGIPDEAFATLPGDDKEVAAELRKKNKEERKGYQSLDFAGRRVEDLDALRDAFTTVANLPERTPEQIREKQRAHDVYRRGVHLRNLKTLADIQVAQFYFPKTLENQRKVTTHDEFRRYLRGQNTHPEPTAYAQAIAQQKRFFHWFLEFPDIFANGGFDCILGNPPYLGGQSLSGTYGHEFLKWVKFEFAPAGSCDLVTYFFRRIFDLLRRSGFYSLISTNSISQGSSREGGLEVILEQGGVIVFAKRSVVWPGRAAVHVVLVSITKVDWNGPSLLDNGKVSRISSYLDDAAISITPYELAANKRLSFQGSILLGRGFVLTPDEAAELISRNSGNKACLFPYLNGIDLNTQPDQTARRWVINFFDWSEKKAQLASNDCFTVVRDKVKRQRDEQNDQGGKEKWWLFLRPRTELYQVISSMERVIVVARVSKTLAFAVTTKGQVFDEKLVVFAKSDFGSFAVLQSTLHTHWAWRFCTTMKADLTYTPTTIFETFPFPSSLRSIESIGETYHEHRRSLMVTIQLGLTKTYNLFHDPNLSPVAVAKVSKQAACVAAELYSRLVQLRELHRHMDNAVLAAYGWHEPSDDGAAIDLRHDFYEVDYLPENDRTRYTIHPDARRELLKRLLLLNHKRHAEEQAAAKTPRPGQSKENAAARKSGLAKQAGPSLFSGDEPYENS
jgi:hypothetical protein